MPQAQLIPAPTPSACRPDRLTRWQRVGLVLLLVLTVLFGGLVEMRSAFLTRRMGDLDVFMRTAWAVRSGQDIYAVTDSNGFHYHYPPLLAILLVPLADPPPEVDSTWTVPYPVTVGLWYVLSVVCLVVAVHWLARALEEATPDPAVRGRLPGCRRWWTLRLLPVLACLPPIGHTLMRGQVNLLLLLLLAGMASALLRGRRWQAGGWLAGAICLKVIPIFLLLVPLYRRDGRCLAGCAVGLAIGLGIVPALVFGPTRTLGYYQEWTEVLLRPALGEGQDTSRARELIEATATDSQSLQAVFHNTLYPEPGSRPIHPGAAVRYGALLAGGILTLLTLLAARGQSDDRPAALIRFGALVVVMALLSPVCHLHYFCLALPLVMGLVAACSERKRALPWGVLLLLSANAVANTLPHIPGLQLVRDDGLALYAALALWLTGILVLRQRRRASLMVGRRPELSRAAA